MKLANFNIGKTILSFCGAYVLLSFATTASAQDAAMKTGGEVSFDSEVIDFKKVVQYSDGTRTFTFTNTGSAPVVVTGVKSSCGCTVPAYTQEPVLPGGKGEIQVTYNTARPGVFQKTLTVLTNTQPPERKLRIMGEVVVSETSEVN
jgi:hypothetical protein